MNYTRLHTFSEISEIKISCRNFLHRSRFDPLKLTEGPVPHRLASLARSAGQRPRPTGSQAPPAASHGGRCGMGRGRGRGPGGPEAHREPAGDVGLAGGWPETTNFGGGGARFRRGIRDGGGDSRHLGSIPLARSKRTSRRTFSERRQGWGKHGTPALVDGHGLL
jgi:hypothetical protein